MNKKKTFADVWDNLENDDQYLTEENILNFTLQIQHLMDQSGITKTDLAEALGTSQAYVTKVFRGNANFTMATMTKLANAINGRLTIHVTPKEEKISLGLELLMEKEAEKELKRAWINMETDSEYTSDDMEVAYS